jgi:hypothetical protein
MHDPRGRLRYMHEQKYRHQASHPLPGGWYPAALVSKDIRVWPRARSMQLYSGGTWDGGRPGLSWPVWYTTFGSRQRRCAALHIPSTQCHPFDKPRNDSNIRWRVCGPIQRGYQTSRNTVFHREPSAWHDKQPILPRHSDPSLFCDTQRILLRPVVLACVRVAGSSYGSVGSSCQAKAENSGSGALPLRAKLPLIAAKPCQPPKWTPSALLSHFVARLIVKEISVDLWICQCWVSSRRTTGCPS